MTTILVIAAVLYGARTLFFWTGHVRHGRDRRRPDLPGKVSVVIPARNEERTIGRCLEALSRSDVDMSLVEVIVVNDRSTDSTGTLLDAFVPVYPWLRVVHRTSNADHPNLQGKPGALQAGFDKAVGDILLMTDSDCAVHPQWIATMASAFHDPKVDLAAGFTLVQASTFLERVQAVEWLFTQTMARGGIGNGVPLGCFGNNLAVRRSAYHAVGGYEGIRFSVTEDLALLQALSAYGSRIRYVCEPEATVTTLPVDSMGEYIRQRHRWARGGMALGWRASMFVIASAMLWVGFIASALEGSWIWFVFFASMRFIVDASMVGFTVLRLRQPALLPIITPALFLLIPTELSLPFLILQRRVVWKNQVFTSRGQTSHDQQPPVMKRR